MGDEVCFITASEELYVYAFFADSATINDGPCFNCTIGVNILGRISWWF